MKGFKIPNPYFFQKTKLLLKFLIVTIRDLWNSSRTYQLEYLIRCMFRRPWLCNFIHEQG